MKGIKTEKNKNEKILFLGEDMRQRYAAKYLRSIGIDADWRERLLLPRARDVLLGCDGVVLPLPTNEKNFEEIFGMDIASFVLFASSVKSCLHIYGGKFSREFLTLAAEHGIETTDYCENEIFLLENAYISAEAALKVIMDSGEQTLRKLSVALIGYGRISKYMLTMLSSLGARVSVVARRKESRDSAILSGAFSVCDTGSDALEYIVGANGKGFDLVVNTVPHMLIDAKLLAKAPKSTRFIDLASLPGGIDIESAQRLGLSASRELGLPAKYAPREAGEVVGRAIYSYLS